MSEEENQTGEEKAPEETPVETAATAAVAVAEAEAKKKRAASPKAAESIERSKRKTRIGYVASNAMQKTIVVEVVRRVPHPQFKKIVKRATKFYVHDEKGEARVGDRVKIMETRPLSKLKRWRLVEVLAH